MKLTSNMNALRRWGIACATLVLAAGLGGHAPQALAQSGNLSLSSGTPSTCTSFSGFSWSNGTLNVTCNSAPPPVQTCDATAATTGFTIDLPTANVYTNATTPVVIKRQGGCAGSYTVSFGTGGFADPNQAGSMATGWSATPASPVVFAQGDVSKTVTVSTGTTAGLIGVWLQGATTGSATVPANGGEAIYVSVPPASGGNGNTATCGSANYVFNMANNNQVIFGSNETASNPGLMPNQTVALAFTFNPAGTGGYVSLSPVVNPSAGQSQADIEISIAQCAGSFQTNPTSSPSAMFSGGLVSADGCDVRVPVSAFTGQGIPVLAATSGNSAGFCHLNPGQAYYLNMRYAPANNFASAASSCGNTSVGCTLRFQPTGISN